MKRTLLLLSFIFIASAIALSQPRSVKFEHLTVEDGLSQNTVSAVLKDEMGFMWFGTNDGLNRYDGSEFQIYKRDPEDTNSLSNNKIYCLLQDYKGYLWVGTANGLNRYSIEKDHFKRYYASPEAGADLGLQHNFIRFLYEDQDSILWAGTLGGGLHRYDRKHDRFMPVKSSGEQRLKNVSAIIEDDHGQLWIGTNYPGIHLYDRASQTFEYFPFPRKLSSKYTYGKNFYKDLSGRLWVGSEGSGLYVFDPVTKSWLRDYNVEDAGTISNNIVKDIAQVQDSLYWIATDGGGLDVLNYKTGNFYNIRYNMESPASISSNAVYSIYKDNHGIYWVGTFDGGINKHNTMSKSFRKYTPLPSQTNTLSHRSVLSFDESHDGKIWIGTDGGGLNLFDPENESFTHFRSKPGNPNSLSANVVTEVYEASNGIVWIGTYGGGLNRFNPQTGNFRVYYPDPEKPNSSISNKNIWDIHEDSKGDLWLASLSGLDKMNRATETFTHYRSKNRNVNDYHQRITTIFEDSRGTIWLGGSGLKRLNREEKNLKYIDYPLFSGFDVRSIYEDSKKRLWVGTEGGGLIHYMRDEEQFRVFNTDDGLPNDAVHAILEDNQGNLWLSTNKGLSRFNPDSLTFQNYQANDGLQSNQFSYDAALKSSSGAMYFGGIKGFNMFYPSRIHKNPYIPPVVITDFEIMNKSVPIGGDEPLDKHISVTEELTLNHKQDVFSFEFKALSYGSSQNNQYMIKMEGFDEKWRDLGGRNYASFTNLPAGDYVFRVKASNDDGVWNHKGAAVKIHVLPPPWRTTWAYIGYTILFIGLLYLARTMLLYKARMKHKLQLKEVEKNKIQELNNMKIRFYTNVSHEFRTPLTLIISPLEHLLSQSIKDPETKKHLSLIHYNAKRLLLLINQLMDFRRIETGHMALHAQKTNIVQFVKGVKEAFDLFAREHKINFKFTSDFHAYNLWFDREKIEKVIYNLLSNAFKFTHDGGRVSVKVQMPEHRANRLKDAYRKIQPKEQREFDYIHIIIEDTGLGISKERLNKIFDRFHQIPSSSNLKSSLKSANSGIGLAITKSMIELHRGYIDVESEEGKGSRFIVSLPIGKKHLGKSELMANLDMDSDKLELHSDDYTEQYLNDQEEQAEAEEQQEHSSDKPDVLVVEDDPSMQEFIRDILKDSYNVTQAMDGMEGLEKAKSLNPTIIISDIMMQGKDGITLSKELKQKLSTSHIPIILLTALSSDQYKMEGYEIGADEYLTKPFNPELLKTRMKNLIETRMRMREHFRRKLICEPQEVTLNSLDEEFLKKAVSIVEENISNPQFNVPQLISELGTSRSALYRKLRSLVDQSANEFIRAIRLKRAAQLLSQNQLTVSEISYRVGYNDPQYFSKSFKKEFSVTPSEYVQNSKNGNNGDASGQ